MATSLSMTCSPSGSELSSSTSPSAVSTRSMKWDWWKTPWSAKVASALAMSRTRIGYWPRMIPSNGSPPCSLSVSHGRPGISLATPARWAISRVSLAPLSSIRWRRMKEVLSESLSACDTEQEPQDCPPTLVTVTLPVVTGDEEIGVPRPMPCSRAAATPKILNTEPVWSGALA